MTMSKQVSHQNIALNDLGLTKKLYLSGTEVNMLVVWCPYTTRDIVHVWQHCGPVPLTCYRSNQNKTILKSYIVVIPLVNTYKVM